MKTEVLIIGGGCAGLSLATALGKQEISVCLVEVRDFTKIPQNTNYYGRTAALMGSSVDFLESLHVWKEIETRTSALKKMRIIDDGNPKIDPVILEFNAKEIGLDSFGHNIPNMMLLNSLLTKAKSCPSVTIISPDCLKNYEVTPSNIIATLKSGKKISAALLVGADGRKSKARDLAGIQIKKTQYGQSAITCLLSHSTPHHETSTEHHRSGGPFTTVPMPDHDNQHCSSLVWVEKTKDADRFMALDKKAFEQAIQKRSRNELGKIKLASHPESWPLGGILAHHFTAPRLALIAEAAHVMSPIGAQGLNLSLRDVSTLSEIISNALKLGEDIGSKSVLDRYENNRKPDIISHFEGVDKYNRLVSNNIEIVRLFRRAGLKSLDHIPALKYLAMKRGLAA